MTWGATAYLIKSSELSELKEKIREALKNKEKRQNQRSKKE